MTLLSQKLAGAHSLFPLPSGNWDQGRQIRRRPSSCTHLALTGVLGLKNSWVTRVAYHETAVKVQRPKDQVRGRGLSFAWPCQPHGRAGCLVKRGGGGRALTCQEEEDTPGDGHTALGDGVTVSNPSALHAHDTEHHGHKAQQHCHDHQGSR